MQNLGKQRIQLKQQGFNLLELLVVLGLIALIISVALPAGKKMLERGRLTSITNEAYAALIYTRNEAIRLRRDYRFCLVDSSSATGCSNSSANNLLGVFRIEGSNSKSLVRTFDLTPNTNLSFSTGNSIEFQRLGNREAINGPAYLIAKAGNQIKQIEVCFNGRILIRKTNNTSEC